MSAVSPFKIVVAVSGQGRSLGNLIKEQHQCGDFSVVGVISSKRSCGAVELAEENSLPVYIDAFDGGDDPAEELCRWLKLIEPDMIVLAGFLKKFPTRFVESCPGTDYMINIHPSLLPKHGGPGMYGNRVHESVLKAGDVMTGASIHLVTNKYDHGNLVSQIRVPVMSDDTAWSLASRVFAAECRLLPATIRAFAQEYRSGQDDICLNKIKRNRMLKRTIQEIS